MTPTAIISPYAVSFRARQTACRSMDLECSTDALDLLSLLSTGCGDRLVGRDRRFDDDRNARRDIDRGIDAHRRFAKAGLLDESFAE